MSFIKNIKSNNFLFKNINNENYITPIRYLYLLLLLKKLNDDVINIILEYLYSNNKCIGNLLFDYLDEWKDCLSLRSSCSNFNSYFKSWLWNDKNEPISEGRCSFITPYTCDICGDKKTKHLNEFVEYGYTNKSPIWIYCDKPNCKKLLHRPKRKMRQK